jgi:hypothetical protein
MEHLNWKTRDSINKRRGPYITRNFITNAAAELKRLSQNDLQKFFQHFLKSLSKSISLQRI